MRSKSKWTSPVIAATGLFLSGIIFGVALPSVIPQQKLSVVLSSITAFGTLLLGIAAIRGVKEWSHQQRLLKQSERAEQALSYLVQIELHINDCKNCLPGLRALPPEYDRVLTERWKSIFKSHIAKLKELSQFMRDDYTSAKKSMFWFAGPTFYKELTNFQKSLDDLVLCLYVFPLDEEIHKLDFSLQKNQHRAESFVEDICVCIPNLEKTFYPIKSRLVLIANLQS